MAMVQFSMPQATIQAVKAEAKSQGLTASEYARRALDSYAMHQREARARISALEAQGKPQTGGAA
jgi:hypothetical protein